MKKKLILLFSIIVFFAIILSAIFLLRNRVIIDDDVDLYYYGGERITVIDDSQDINIDAKTAISIAKSVIKAYYRESILLHGPYHIYLDPETRLYYITADGFLFFHASCFIVINQRNGAIISVAHGKA